MSAAMLLAATGVAAGSAGIAKLIVPPTTRLSPRVRPYATVARIVDAYDQRAAAEGDKRREARRRSDSNQPAEATGK